MRKILFVLALAALTLAALVAPVAAAPASDLTALAEYFPPDTPVFFSVRTDAGFLDALDALIETARGNLPPGAMPPFSLRQAIDQSLSEQYGDEATFESVFGWLGDSAAFGITSFETAFDDDWRNDDEMPALVAIEITDRGAAEAMLTAMFEEQETDVERETRGDWLLLTPATPSNAFWALNDEALLVATSPDLLPLSDDRRSLAGDADFGASLAGLPAPDYSAVLALNIRDTMRASYGMMMELSSDEPAAEFMRSLQPLYENYPRQTIGFTILDGRTLALDFAQSAFDYAALEGAFGNMAALLDAKPVDLAFAERVPADAPFMLLGSNLGNSVSYGISAFAVLAEMGIQADLRYDDDDDRPAFVEDIDANDVRAFVDLAVAGMTGLNLERDILPYVNGAAAFYARGLPVEGEDIALDTALVVEVTDEAATRHIYNALVEALSRYEADFTEADGVLVLPDVIRGLYPRSVPQSDLQAPEYDFLIGLNEDVLAAGTRAAVEHGLNPSGDGLADNAAFQTARAQFLPDAQSVGYIGFAATRDLVELAARFSGKLDDDAEAALMALGLFESAAYSALIDDHGGSVARFTLTLAE